jgi:hypothetical protein
VLYYIYIYIYIRMKLFNKKEYFKNNLIAWFVNYLTVLHLLHMLFSMILYHNYSRRISLSIVGLFDRGRCSTILCNISNLSPDSLTSQDFEHSHLFCFVLVFVFGPHTHTHTHTHTHIHSYRAASWYYQHFIYSPTDAPVSCLKKTVLKFTLNFTLKQLQHVSVFSYTIIRECINLCVLKLQVKIHQCVVNTVWCGCIH